MKIYFLLILCVSFWSGNFVVGRFIRFELDAIELSYFRWLCVCFLFLPQIIKYRKNIIYNIKNHFLYSLASGLLGIASFNTLLYLGLKDTMATNALMINSSIPILIILFSWIFLKAKITKLQLSGVILSMIGVIFLALNGSLQNLLNFKFNHGDILVFASSVTWAGYSVLLKVKSDDIKAFLPTAVIIGTVLLTPVFLLSGHHFSTIISVDLSGKLAILYTALFASMASYILWAKGIETLGANKTGQFTHLMPVFGIILAYLFLGEKMHLYHIYGFGLIIFGLWLSLFYKAKNLG